jgi:hypothetical protein
MTSGPFYCWYFLLLKLRIFLCYPSLQVMAILCCVAKNSLHGTVILRPFDSWGTNIFVSIQKKLSSSLFFMLWSRGIDSKEPVPLANVAWTHICKRFRSPVIDSKEPIPLANVVWARICKCLRSPGIDSKEPILLANVAWARICKCLRSPGIDSKESILLANEAWARICKRLRSPGIDSEESIGPAYVTWRAGTTSRVVVPARQAGNRFRTP